MCRDFKHVPDSNFFFSIFKLSMPAPKLHPPAPGFPFEGVGQVRRPQGPLLCSTARQAAPRRMDRVTSLAAGKRGTGSPEGERQLSPSQKTHHGHLSPTLGLKVDSRLLL